MGKSFKPSMFPKNKGNDSNADYNSMSRGSAHKQGNNNGNHGGAQGRPPQSAPAPRPLQQPALPPFKFEGFDPVNEAEKCILNLSRDKNDKLQLTTSQLRKFLTAAVAAKNKVDLYFMQHDAADLPSDLAVEVKFLRATLAYQAGRENPVKDFSEKSKLPSMINSIGNSKEHFQTFCKYVEALVAYHKFYGGKDK